MFLLEQKIRSHQGSCKTSNRATYSVWITCLSVDYYERNKEISIFFEELFFVLFCFLATSAACGSSHCSDNTRSLMH